MLFSPAAVRTVPEHSQALMQAVSGGAAALRDGYLFFTGDDWLVGVGYPLAGAYDAGRFWAALTAVARSRAIEDCWAIAPVLPEVLRPYAEEEDVYYVLAADAPVPRALRGPVRRAGERLRIEEGRDFTAEHRRLWAEFVRRRPLKPQARELFARTPAMLEAPGADVRLLNAWDGGGHLAACCVMDYSPEGFCSYVIGAHSRLHYTPHAADALFAAMLRNARAAGRAYVHLGLGVNEGVSRFKRKWGGVPAQAYRAASWRMSELPAAADSGGGGGVLREAVDASLAALLGSGGSAGGRKLPEQPQQRPYAMLWEARREGRLSYLGGTAHLFCCSFADSFRSLFRRAETVLFEGPLDAASLALVAARGAQPGAGPAVAGLLTEEEIRRLEGVVRGPQGRLARFLNVAWPDPADVRGILATHRPWSVFFSLYYAYLQRQGWNLSVDLEAWEIAHGTGCRVLCMESIDDQLASLESIPLERILNFLRHPETWRRHMRQTRRAYLAGDIGKMQGAGTEFPSRTERVISARDDVFLEAMLPHFQRGGAVALVGTAHLFRLRDMLRQRGFALRQVRPTLWHRLKGLLRGEP